MIKLLSIIRKKLLAEGKTANYLKYAIGEIALVMIGILLALQVNNWNENRKTNIAYEKLIISFHEELKSNINNANSNINYNYRMDSIMQLILNNKLSRKMLEDNSQYLGFINFYTSTIRFSDENLNLLLNQKEDLPNKYAFLKDDLSLLKELIESQKKWENYLLDFVMENRKNNDLNLLWLNKTDSISQFHKIDYVLNNPIFYNQLVTFSGIQLAENVFDMNNVRVVSLKLLRKIAKLQNTLNDQDALDFIKALGFETLPKFNCNDSIPPINNKASFRMSTPIYNATQDTVTIFRTNEKGERLEFKIPGNSIEILFRDFLEGKILTQDNNGACAFKYQAKRNSVLLIQ